MNYRKFASGSRVGMLGLGSAKTGSLSKDEIVRIMRAATNHGVNFIDLDADRASFFEAAGEALKNRRKDVFLQLHFGIDYEDGNNKKTFDAGRIMTSVTWQMQQMRIDYLDYACIHGIGSMSDHEQMKASGVIDLLSELKNGGVVHGISLDCSDPRTALDIMRDGLADLLMLRDVSSDLSMLRDVSSDLSVLRDGSSDLSMLRDGSAGGAASAEEAGLYESSLNEVLSFCDEHKKDVILRLGSAGSHLTQNSQLFTSSLQHASVKAVIKDAGSLEELYKDLNSEVFH